MGPRCVRPVDLGSSVFAQYCHMGGGGGLNPGICPRESESGVFEGRGLAAVSHKV
jgi:hypothetical protein